MARGGENNSFKLRLRLGRKGRTCRDRVGIYLDLQPLVLTQRATRTDAGRIDDGDHRHKRYSTRRGSIDQLQRRSRQSGLALVYATDPKTQDHEKEVAPLTLHAHTLASIM